MPVQSWVRQHALSTFFAGSIGVGSLITGAALLLPRGKALMPLVAIPVSYAPAIAAIAVVGATGDHAARAALMRRMSRFQVDPRWYGAAAVALPLVHIAGVRLAVQTGTPLPVHARALALLPLFLVTSAGEEIGWRGYALPALSERDGLFKAALIVGLGWAAFHSVALLANSDAPVAYVVVSTVLFTGLSVVIAYVFDGSGQALPVAVLMHAAYNTVSVGVMPLAETKAPLRAFALSALVAWGAAVGLVVARRQATPLASLAPQSEAPL